MMVFWKNYAMTSMTYLYLITHLIALSNYMIVISIYYQMIDVFLKKERLFDINYIDN